MTGPPQTFEIRESRSDGRLRLSLIGELDSVSAHVLEDRLVRLRASKSPISFDLSRLEFIDSTGIRLFIQTIGDARLKRWEVKIEPGVSPQVMRLFRLVRIDGFVLESPPDWRSADHGRPRPTP